jgi:hypothetical protein
MKKQLELKGLNYYHPSFINEKAAASDGARFMVDLTATPTPKCHTSASWTQRYLVAMPFLNFNALVRKSEGRMIAPVINAYERSSTS